MLVLTRKVGETIIIGGDIRVTVMEVDGRGVRIGVYAPPEIAVDREEIHIKKQERANGNQR